MNEDGTVDVVYDSGESWRRRKRRQGNDRIEKLLEFEVLGSKKLQMRGL